MKERIKKLEQELAELKAQLDKPEFEKFQKGDWLIPNGKYSNSAKDYIVRFNKYTGTDTFASSEMVGRKTGHEGWATECFRKATKSEITKALIKEAERRGFYDTSKYIKNTFNIGQSQDEPRKIQQYHDDKEISYKYMEDDDSLYCDSGMKTFRKFCSNPTIYKKGKWADVMETENKFFEWDVKYNESSDSFDIGCNNYHRKELKLIRDALENVPAYTAEEITNELKKLNL